MKYFFSIIVYLLLQVEVIACDCAFPPKTFMTSISQYTAELEVVQIDTVLVEGRSKYQPLILSKLRVIKSFNNSIELDYVWMSNPGDAGCQRGIEPKHIGQKYIITGNIFEDKINAKWIEDSGAINFLNVSICGKRLLDIEGENVRGVITNDISEKIMKRYYRLMKKDDVKARAYYQKAYNTKHQSNLKQTMPLSEFYELMEQKMIQIRSISPTLSK